MCGSGAHGAELYKLVRLHETRMERAWDYMGLHGARRIVDWLN